MTTQSRQRSRDAPARDRAINALQLRKLGLSYDIIAKQCGYRDRSVAWHTVQRLLGKYEVESVDQLRQVEGERLNDLQQAVMVRALKGDLEAVLVVLRIMTQRARLFGLNVQADAPANPLTSPEFQATMHLLFDALRAYPEARQAVISQIEAERAKRRGA